MKRRNFIFVLGFSILLTACSGLAGEPGIVSTSAVPTVTPTPVPDVGVPQKPVNMARGAAIFNDPQQGCNQCHGTGGKGDGQTAQNFTCKLTDFTDAGQQRSKSISSLFAIVTNGNGAATTCLMPPWNGRYNEQDRWDVTSYIYSLHYTPDVLAAGQKIWASSCAACHGDHGAGDGTRAPSLKTKLANYTDPAFLPAHSDEDLYNAITNGAGTEMPSFAKDLDENSRWAVVAYLRSMTWDNSAAPSPTPVPTDSANVTVSGTLTNGTTNAPLSQQPLTLRVIDASNSSAPHDVTTLQTQSGIAGSFSFANIPRQNGLVYIVTTQYAGLLQVSTPLKLQSGTGNTLDLSFKVYDLTNDPGVMTIETREVVVDFVTANSVQINEGLRLTNTSNKIFTTDQQIADGHKISVQIGLPAGAQNITLDPNSTAGFAADTATNSIRSVSPISPDDPALLQFSYNIAFNNQLTVTNTLPYSMTSMTVYVPQVSGVTIAGTVDKLIFVPSGPLQLQNGNYDGYTLQSPVRAGTQIGFEVVGQAQQAAEQRGLIAIVLGVALIAILGMVGLIWRLSRGTPNDPETLLQMIAALDDKYAAGEIARNAYESKRARLKAKITGGK